MFFYGIKKQCTVLGIIWMERHRKTNSTRAKIVVPPPPYFDFYLLVALGPCIFVSFIN